MECFWSGLKWQMSSWRASVASENVLRSRDYGLPCASIDCSMPLLCLDEKKLVCLWLRNCAEVYYVLCHSIIGE